MDIEICGLFAGIFLIFSGFSYSFKIEVSTPKKVPKKVETCPVLINIFKFLKRDDLDLCEVVCKKWRRLIRRSDAVLPKRELILAKPEEGDKLGLFDEKGFVFAYNSANLQGE